MAGQPFPDPDSRWSDAGRRRYRELLGDAREVGYLEHKVPDTRAKVGGSLGRRDRWLARSADEAVLVWDRRHEQLGGLARTLDDQLGDDVWILEP